MKSFVQKGDTLSLIAPSGGVIGGNAYLIGALLAVAVASVPEGEPFEGRVTGVYELPSASGGTTGWAQGALLYWDNTAKVITKTATDNTLIGHAAAAKDNAGTIGIVRLSQ